MAVWRALEEAGRSTLPGEPPPLDAAAGLWAAERLFFACQAIVCRDLDTEEVRPRILVPCPSPRNPSTVYSADVCLRHLPEVARLAQRLAASDPVNSLVHEFASDWPLSSVGVPQLEFFTVDSFWRDATLRRLFVDRVIEHQCISALKLPAVADAVRAAIGAHDDLAPALATSLHDSPALTPSS